MVQTSLSRRWSGRRVAGALAGMLLGICVGCTGVPGTDLCSGVTCDDGLYCNGAETCDPLTGLCQSGEAPCADLGLCDEDADFCAAETACTTDADCRDDDYCNGEEACDPDTSTCVAGSSPCAEGVVCDEEADECLDPTCACAGDADCDDGVFCNGAEVCVDCVCVSDASPCSADETCNEGTDTCGSGAGCVLDTECDDGLFCNGQEYCTDAGVCTTNGAPCLDDESCDEDGDVCLLADLEVDVSGCSVVVAPGEVLAVSAATIYDRGTVRYTWDLTGDAEFVYGADTGATVTIEVGEDPFVVSVVAVDDFGTPDDASDDREAEATCTPSHIPDELTITCDALELPSIPSRTSSAYHSDDPGEGDTALMCTATEPGYVEDDFTFAWTAVSLPPTAGGISFDDSGSPETGWSVLAPAVAGEYVFRLTATNSASGAQVTQDVTVNFLNVGTVWVQEGFEPIRFNLLQSINSEGADVTLGYTCEARSVIRLYDGTGSDDDALLESVTVPPGENSAINVHLPVEGKLITDAPNAYHVQYTISDDTGTSELTDLVDPSYEDGLGQLVLYIGKGETYTADTSDVPEIDLHSVGELDGSGDIIHQGVGAGAPQLIQVARYTVVEDMNNDGVGDLVTLRTVNAGFEIRYGSPDIVTAGEPAGSGDDWPDADVSIDVSDGYASFSVGDFNGDGNLDIVAVDSLDYTRAVQVFLLDGAETAASVGSASRTYNFRYDYDIRGPIQTAAGDVSGDGIDDIAVSLPYAEYDLSSGGDADGVIGIIYGTATLPASYYLWDDSVTGAKPAGQYNGERLRDTAAGEKDAFGVALTIGQFNNQGGLDLWAAEGTDGKDLRLFLGGSGQRMSTSAQRELVLEAMGDLWNGVLRMGDVTNDGVPDLVILSPAKSKIYIANNSTVDQTVLSSLPEWQGTISINGTAWESTSYLNDLELYDVNGDGDLDIVFGDAAPDTGNRVLVIEGPHPLSRDLAASDFMVVYQGESELVGKNIVFGDINGDGLDDFLFGSTTELFMLAGVE